MFRLVWVYVKFLSALCTLLFFSSNAKTLVYWWGSCKRLSRTDFLFVWEKLNGNDLGAYQLRRRRTNLAQFGKQSNKQQWHCTPSKFQEETLGGALAGCVTKPNYTGSVLQKIRPDWIMFCMTLRLDCMFSQVNAFCTYFFSVTLYYKYMTVNLALSCTNTFHCVFNTHVRPAVHRHHVSQCDSVNTYSLCFHVHSLQCTTSSFVIQSTQLIFIFLQ